MNLVRLNSTYLDMYVISILIHILHGMRESQVYKKARRQASSRERAAASNRFFVTPSLRNVMDGARLLEVSPLFEQAAQAHGIYTPDLKMEFAIKGLAQDFSRVPQDLKDLFVTALDIRP
jgi:hypothetical protein